MKRTIAFLTLLALVALPASVMAAKTGDFELGGYIKLHTWWDSTNNVNKNISVKGSRNNAFGAANQGKFRMTAQDTRFNFKIKGPDVWGAKTQGYIEVDFDGSGQDPEATVTYAVQPRLRHAWFRFDWPGGWQLLMGQYWGVFCNYWPDTVNSGPLFGHGMATQRLPQIRLTYKTGPWTFIGMAGIPNDGTDNAVGPQVNVNGVPWLPGTGPYEGGRTSMPQFGLQLIFEKDLYGKAAFFSRPRGFSASVSFGVQRTKYDAGVAVGNTWGQNNYGTTMAFVQESQTLVPWMVQASMFVPLIPTQTADLRGTASLQLQCYVGQGLRAFGNDFLGGSNSFFVYDNFQNTGGFTNVPVYTHKLMKRYGGYIQGQYYFNNEWYLSYVYGFAKAYGVSQDRNPLLVTAANPAGYEFANTGDPIKFIQEHNVTLFYRPMKNFKFGLSYVYLQTDYFQITTVSSSQTSDGDTSLEVKDTSWRSDRDW
ncbi:MAG: hypothetical protein P8X65_14160 [Syntrophobacterales bacterium]